MVLTLQRFLKGEEGKKINTRYKIDSIENEITIMQNPVLRAEYQILFEHQGFCIQGL